MPWSAAAPEDGGHAAAPQPQPWSDRGGALDSASQSIFGTAPACFRRTASCLVSRTSERIGSSTSPEDAHAAIRRRRTQQRRTQQAALLPTCCLGRNGDEERLIAFLLGKSNISAGQQPKSTASATRPSRLRLLEGSAPQHQPCRGGRGCVPPRLLRRRAVRCSAAPRSSLRDAFLPQLRWSSAASR